MELQFNIIIPYPNVHTYLHTTNTTRFPHFSLLAIYLIGIAVLLYCRGSWIPVRKSLLGTCLTYT